MMKAKGYTADFIYQIYRFIKKDYYHQMNQCDDFSRKKGIELDAGSKGTCGCCTLAAWKGRVSVLNQTRSSDVN